MPNRMDVMSPVVFVTASIPSRNAKASTGFILNTKGSMRASVVGPPRPGRIPTAKPMATPISMSPKVGQAKTWTSPVQLAWATSTIGGSPSLGGLLELRANGGREAVHHVSALPHDHRVAERPELAEDCDVGHEREDGGRLGRRQRHLKVDLHQAVHGDVATLGPRPQPLGSLDVEHL